ncbi:unnamed protein product, partial [Tilletia caries]
AVSTVHVPANQRLAPSVLRMMRDRRRDMLIPSWQCARHTDAYEEITCVIFE